MKHTEESIGNPVNDKTEYSFDFKEIREMLQKH